MPDCRNSAIGALVLCHYLDCALISRVTAENLGGLFSIRERLKISTSNNMRQPWLAYLACAVAARIIHAVTA